ncbi:MAG: ComF family protein [Clostridia bacterium]|nr:ComF family protein [Clostridia bacterium]
MQMQMRKHALSPPANCRSFLFIYPFCTVLKRANGRGFVKPCAQFAHYVPFRAKSRVFYDAKSNLPLNNLVFKLKRDYNRDIIEFCATEIVKNLKSLCLRHGIDYKDYLITYTPRRVSGKRKYGFDHSKRMAIEISKLLGIKTIKTLINVGTAEQKTLSKEKRKENAKQSYELSKNASVSGKKLFIVDDIITSGSTMKACADLLYQSGATDIIPLAFAKDNR